LNVENSEATIKRHIPKEPNLQQHLCENFKTRIYKKIKIKITPYINTLNAELNPICHLLALLGTHPILHVSRIRVNMKVRTDLRSRRFLGTHWTGDRVNLILDQEVAKTISQTLPRNEP